VIRPGRNRLSVQEHRFRTEPTRQLRMQQRSVAVAVLPPVVDEHPTTHHGPPRTPPAPTVAGPQCAAVDSSASTRKCPVSCNITRNVAISNLRSSPVRTSESGHAVGPGGGVGGPVASGGSGVTGLGGTGSAGRHVNAVVPVGVDRADAGDGARQHADDLAFRLGVEPAGDGDHAVGYLDAPAAVPAGVVVWSAAYLGGDRVVVPDQGPQQVAAADSNEGALPDAFDADAETVADEPSE